MPRRRLDVLVQFLGVFIMIEGLALAGVGLGPRVLIALGVVIYVEAVS